MIKTTIDVGKILPNGEALLLPMINDIFNSHACYIIRIKQQEDSVNAKELVTSRWILLQLTANLKKHVASTCKVCKYGTLIYRPNTDLSSVISELLWKIRGLEINKSDDNIPENTCKFKRIHSSIKTLLATDAKIPFDYSKFNINNSIQQIDSDLWSPVCTLTKSVSECRGTSMVNDPSSHIYESKWIRRLFLFSTILFCTDDQCCTYTYYITYTYYRYG